MFCRGFYKNICLKESEVWRKVISNKINFTLVTQGSGSVLDLRQGILKNKEFAKRLQCTSANRESDFFTEIERTNKENDL